ncbi:MAG: DUF2341 domain-containing protein [Candidatus Lokiarchaeia archaeon]
MGKLSLKNRLYKQKYVLLALIPISLFLGSLYTPIYLFSHTSNNNLTNLLIINGIIQKSTDQSLQKQEQPWLSGWNYRKSHTIIGSTAGEQTDYQMKIMVHYGSGNDSGENIYCNAYCRSDFGDIRFAKSDGTTLFDYWMEEKTDGGKATFWVEIDSITASPQSINIYVYYGNDGASTTSNGESTFIFFDDFLGSFVDGGKWDEVTKPSGTITVSNSELDLELDSGTGYVVLDSDNSYTAANCIVEAKAKGVHDGGSTKVQSPKMSVFDSQTSRNYGAEILFQGTNNIRFAWYTGPWGPFVMFFLLKPSELNPLVYLALGLTTLAILIIGGLGVKRKRAEVPEGEVMLESRGPPTKIRPQCVYCGCELSENANFCPLCGMAVAFCSVCNLDIFPGDPIVRCPHCDVLNHKDHLLEWIKIRGYCPNCREKLNLLKKV